MAGFIKNILSVLVVPVFDSIQTFISNWRIRRDIGRISKMEVKIQTLKERLRNEKKTKEIVKGVDHLSSYDVYTQLYINEQRNRDNRDH